MSRVGAVHQGRGRNRSGLADAPFKLSANLMGNRAMTAREFVAETPRTIVGNDATTLINLGTHRWVFKREGGVSVPKGRWHFDAYAGAWFATANRKFFPRVSIRTQDPVLTVQGARQLRISAAALGRR